jgi:hypothetical protein
VGLNGLLVTGMIKQYLFVPAVCLVLFAAVAEAALTTEWMGSAELDEYRIAANDMYPAAVEGRVQHGELHYRATFEYFPQGLNYYYSYWGQTDGWFEHKNSELLALAYQLHSHQSFVNQNGATLHQATWVLLGPVESVGDSPWFFLFNNQALITVVIVLLAGIFELVRKEWPKYKKPAISGGSETSRHPNDPVKW